MTTSRVREQHEREKHQLRDEIVQLKEHIKSMTTQQYEEKRKWHHEISEVENHYVRLRKEDIEKVKKSEEKHLLAETELSNFKNMEMYLQSEARSLKEEEEMFSSIRGQLDKINGDWNKIDSEKSQEIEQIKEESSLKSQKISELEYELEKEKLGNLHSAKTIKELHTKLQEHSQLQTRVKSSEAERQELTEKNYILEALTLTHRHRQGVDVSERIGEFERRVHLLIDEKGRNMGGMASLQQIIILKGYVQ